MEEVRRAEARALMNLIEDAVAVTQEELDSVLNSEETATQGDVQSMILELLTRLSSAENQIASAIKRVALYSIQVRGLTRQSVAQAIGVSSMTVGRWVKEAEESGDNEEPADS